MLSKDLKAIRRRIYRRTNHAEVRKALDQIIERVEREEKDIRNIPRFGLMIRRLRGRHDISLRELNDLCFGHKSHTTLYTLERGDVEGKLVRGALRLRKYFAVPASVFVRALEKEFYSDPPGSRSGRSAWRGRLGPRRKAGAEKDRS